MSYIFMLTAGIEYLHTLLLRDFCKKYISYPVHSQSHNTHDVLLSYYNVAVTEFAELFRPRSCHSF